MMKESKSEIKDNSLNKTKKVVIILENLIIKVQLTDFQSINMMKSFLDFTKSDNFL